MTPLPFAPPPKDSSLYQQLESTTLQTLTPDQLDTIRAKTFSQGTDGNEDEYRRLLLLGLAAQQLSVSGPMPGTAKIVESSVSSSGDQVIAFTPGAGEIWEFQGVDARRTGSGTILYQMFLVDTKNSTEIYFYYKTDADTNVIFFNDADSRFFASPIYFDENVTLKLEATDSGGTFTDVTFSTAVVRVR